MGSFEGVLKNSLPEKTSKIYTETAEMEYLFNEVENWELQFHYKSILSKTFFAIFGNFLRRAILKNNLRGVSEPCQRSKMEPFVKIVYGN